MSNSAAYGVGVCRISMCSSSKHAQCLLALCSGKHSVLTLLLVVLMCVGSVCAVP